jgi:putative ABC transport system permease protein
VGTTIVNDIRYATRMLLKSRGFAIAALTALALGIGATTAMFSVVNSILLRPLPFPDPERLFVVRETRAQAGFEKTVVAEGEYLAWGRDNALIEHAAVVAMPGLAIKIGDTPERLPSLQVPADFFPLFGVVPAAGRAFGRDAEQPGRGDVILISYAVWKQRLNGSEGAIGKTITVEGRPTTVIGVLPRRFSFGSRVDAVVPMTLGPDQARQVASHALDMYARLRAGVSPQQASADLSRRLLASQGTPAHATGVALVPLHEEMLGDSRTPMLILFGAVALVLLIACANIANLLLARASGRQKEIAIRTALGATRARVVRQLLTESVLLSIAGGSAGILLSLWLTDVIGRAAAETLPRAGEIAVDQRALLFAMGISAFCGVLFGVAPAWQLARFEVNSVLKREARGGTSAGRARALGLFATAEIALALVLLVSAGLLLASFQNLQRVDAGFDPAHVVTAPAYLPEWKYASPERQRQFFARAVQASMTVPGVSAAAAVNVLPLSGNNSSGAITPEGYPPPPPGQRESADRRVITPRYFEAMGIRVLEGRAFTETDDERAQPVAIVSRSFAEHYWPRESAVGKRLKLARYESPGPWLTIVGVAADVRHGTLANPSRQVVYFPHAQRPSPSMDLVVRSSGAPGMVIPSLRETIRRMDPDLPVELQLMTDIVHSSLLDREIEFGMLTTFAAFALALAAAGIYGVMAYAMTQRLQEFGVRIALGATPGDILRLVGWYGARLTGAGLAAGLGGAYLAGAVLRDLLFGIAPRDPFVFGAAAAVLGAVAIAACVLPARRALRADPVVALRAE